MFFRQVSPKTAGVFEGKVALITLQWFFSSMLAHVYFQTTSFTAIVDAFITLEWFLSSVFALVYFQSSSLSA